MFFHVREPIHVHRLSLSLNSRPLCFKFAAFIASPRLVSEEDSASAVVGVSAVLLRAQVAGRAQSSVAGGEEWGWGVK